MLENSYILVTSRVFSFLDKIEESSLDINDIYFPETKSKIIYEARDDSDAQDLAYSVLNFMEEYKIRDAGIEKIIEKNFANRCGRVCIKSLDIEKTENTEIFEIFKETCHLYNDEEVCVYLAENLEIILTKYEGEKRMIFFEGFMAPDNFKDGFEHSIEHLPTINIGKDICNRNDFLKRIVEHINFMISTRNMGNFYRDKLVIYFTPIVFDLKSKHNFAYYDYLDYCVEIF